MTLQQLPPGVEIGKRYRDYATVLCSHDECHRTRLETGEMWCSFCKVTESRSDGFVKRVFSLVTLSPSVVMDAQPALF